MVSTHSLVCPYCKYENNKYEAIGGSGLININGKECCVQCNNCNKYFTVLVDVVIKYKTSKTD